jgi:hypothetical protein
MVYHLPVLLVAGVVVGVGMAIYANRDDIKAYIDKKRLERRLREGPRRRRQQPPMLSRHFDNGDDDIYDKSGEFDSEMKHIDSDTFSLQELPQKQEFDQQSVASSFELGESTSYYTSGVTSSDHQTPRSPDSGSAFLPSYRLRQRGPQAPHYYEEPPQYEFHPARSRTDSISLSEVSTEPSLVYSRRSSVSDSSWIRPGSSLGTESELATPLASEISPDDDYQSLLHVSEDDSSTYQLRRLPRAHA